MLGLRRLRFVDIGTGLSMVLGTAGMLAASALFADEPMCSAPMSCTQTQPVCCDQIFEDAAARLKNLYAGLNCDTCAAPATPATTCAPAADSCSSTGGCGSTAAAAPATTFGLTDLFDDDCGHNHFKDNGWKLGGNLAQSYTYNPQNPGNHWNGPVTWTDQSNQYQLNQFWLYAEKLVDTSKTDWAWGARGDINYGTSSRLFTETGLETYHLNGPGTYGLALPQFYGEVGYKKFKVTVGHWISPIGYQTVDTTQNFFSTIPYTYQWGEPFTHTGAKLTWQATDDLVISSAAIRGWDNFAGGNGHLGNITTVSYNFKDKSNLTYVGLVTQEPNFSNAVYTQRYYQSLVYTKPINDNLTYVGQTDFGTQRNAFGDGKRANWYGLNQYLFYKVNDNWTWGINGEWWRDEEGFRVGSFLPGTSISGITGNPNGVTNLPFGNTGNFYQCTMGPRWYPTGKPNFFIRPSARVDWYSGDSQNSGGIKPYNNGASNYQGLLITDVCILF